MRAIAEKALFILAAVALLIVLAPGAAAQKTALDERLTRLYDLEIEGIDSEDAEQLLKQKCHELNWTCDTKWAARRWLSVEAPPAAHDWFRAQVDAWNAPPPTLVFKLYLLVARPGSGPVPPLSPAAAAALDDLKGFLPGVAFELQGTGLVSLQPGRERGRILVGGSDGYEAAIEFQVNGSPGAIRVSFSLSRRVPVRLQDDKGNVTVSESRKGILDNAFGMKIGETVVVGTSQAGEPGESLIVLLSADPS